MKENKLWNRTDVTFWGAAGWNLLYFLSTTGVKIVGWLLTLALSGAVLAVIIALVIKVIVKLFP